MGLNLPCKIAVLHVVEMTITVIESMKDKTVRKWYIIRALSSILHKLSFFLSIPDRVKIAPRDEPTKMVAGTRTLLKKPAAFWEKSFKTTSVIAPPFPLKLSEVSTKNFEGILDTRFAFEVSE